MLITNIDTRHIYNIDIDKTKTDSVLIYNGNGTWVTHNSNNFTVPVFPNLDQLIKSLIFPLFNGVIIIEETKNNPVGLGQNMYGAYLYLSSEE